MLSASLIDQQAALDAGARFFLAKPYQVTSLLTAVERAIAENHCEQES
jgi:FixJ family two-component response regulator